MSLRTLHFVANLGILVGLYVNLQAFSCPDAPLGNFSCVDPNHNWPGDYTCQVRTKIHVPCKAPGNPLRALHETEYYVNKTKCMGNQCAYDMESGFYDQASSTSCGTQGVVTNRISVGGGGTVSNYEFTKLLARDGAFTPTKLLRAPCMHV